MANPLAHFIKTDTKSKNRSGECPGCGSTDISINYSDTNHVLGLKCGKCGEKFSKY